jgi:hypothetical protein
MNYTAEDLRNKAEWLDSLDGDYSAPTMLRAGADALDKLAAAEARIKELEAQIERQRADLLSGY